MPRYSSYGRLDSQQVDDGDTSFQKINSRLRPDQLKSGEVAYSQNGRMDVDGAWQTRKGYKGVAGGITSGASALVLPFNLNDSSPPVLNDSAVNAVYGSCLYSDPNSTASEYIVLATNSLAKLVKIVSGTYSSPTNISYPTATTIDGTCELLQTFNRVFIFRDGQVAMQWSGIVPSISSAERVSNDVRLTLSGDTYLEVGDVITVAGITGYSSTNPNGSFTVTQVESGRIVHYSQTGTNSTGWNIASSTISVAFKNVSNGAYTQPLVYDDSANTAIAEGVVTITTPIAHDISIGDLVMVSDRGTTDLNPLTQYRVYAVTTSSPYTFTFKADAANATGATISVGRRQSIGLGFTHMPTPPWAIFHQRRLWMPFKYNITGTSGTPTITSRNVIDEVIASDILDENTYDQIQNQYKLASGSADYLVALQPFAEDNIVALARNSIHLMRGVGADLGNSSVQEITREVGCVARKSVVQVGSQIMFLSDNGIYAVEFDQLYNLRGASVPLSEAINPTIKNINRQSAQNSVAVYHDNRYYIAVPIGNSTVNNCILIYNFLNQGWESIESVDDFGWNITAFIRAGAGGLNKLHTVNKDGGLHLIDDYDSNLSSDSVYVSANSGLVTKAIDSFVTTRQYTFGTMDRKRFNSFELHLESDPTWQSDADLSFEVENPDSINDLGSVLDIVGHVVPSGEDISIRARIGNKRGYGGQITITPSQGRPKIRAFKATGVLAFGSTTSTQ